MGGWRRSAVLGPIDRLFRSGTSSGLSDGQLLERFARRHDEVAEAAFAAIVERHGPMVLRVCRRALGDPHAAQDAFQATFLVLVRKARSVRNRESLAGWLYGVAVRVSAHARASSARRRAAERSAGPKDDVAADDGRPGREVWDEVDRLPESLRAAVVLCYLEGLTHEQAAQRLGWPVGTVRSRLARARDRLRGRLARRGLAPEGVTLAALTSSPEAPPLPAELVDPMVKAAMLIAARDAAEAGFVSASAASLTEGVLRTMLFAKLKSVAAAGLAAGALATRAGAFAYQTPIPVPSADVRAEATEPARSRPTQGHLNPFAAQAEKLTRDAAESQRRGDYSAADRALRELQDVSRAWARHLPGSSERETQSTGLPGARTADIAPPDAAPVPPAPSAPPAPPAPPTPFALPRAAAEPPAADMRPLPPPRARTFERFPPPPGGDTERRLDEVERKLDRILRALEGEKRAAGSPSVS